MLPSINRILTSLQKLRFAAPVIENINNQLKEKSKTINLIENLSNSNFQSEIRFENVCFTYPGTIKKIFDDLNISIKKEKASG